MREVTLPQLLPVYVVVNIDGFSANISPELLDELATYACAPQICTEKVTSYLEALHVSG